MKVKISIVDDDGKTYEGEIELGKKKSESKNVGSRTAKGGKSIEVINRKLLEEINVDELFFVKSLKSVRDKCLALLNYVDEKLPQYSGLTTDEMKNILADKFGLTTVIIENISMSLKNITGKYVTREKILQKTKKYRYQILKAGKEYISDAIQKLQK